MKELKEIDALEAEQETARLQAIVDNANAGTQAKDRCRNSFKWIPYRNNLGKTKSMKEIKKYCCC